MKTYYASDIIYYTLDEMYARINDLDEFVLSFDDSDIVTTWQQTLLCWFMWEYHREYPRIPILVKHHINYEPLLDTTLIKISERITDEIKRCYPDEDESNIHFLTYQIESNVRQFYSNDPEISRYVRSLDAESFVRIYRDPDIRKVIENTSPTKNSIRRGYERIQEIMENKPELRYDEISSSVRERGSKVGQVMQVIGYRGFTSEINQMIYPNAVMANYSVGIKRLSFFSQGSRDAAKALMATDNPVKKTEYYNREMQLFTYTIKKIHLGDCGSTMTIDWLVKANELDGIINGRYYYDDNNELKEIRKRDRHLIGKTIRMRTTAYCQHPEDGVYCLCCTGALGLQIQRDDKTGWTANAGYVMTVANNQKTTQDVISTKHLLLSAIRELYRIDEYYRSYISNFDDGLDIYLSNKMSSKNFMLTFKLEEVSGLSYLSAFTDEADVNIEKIDVHSYSQLEDVVFLVDESGTKKYLPETVALSHGSFKPSLSVDMLRYIRDMGYTYTVDGKRIVIDMRKWDQELPLFVLPERHASTLDYMEEIKKNLFGQSSKKNYRYMADFNDPKLLEGLLREMTELTNRKFLVNLGIIDIIVTALMARNPDEGDYRPPKAFTGKRYCTQKDIMTGRSLSALAAYEWQAPMVETPDSYVFDVRSNHVMDYLITNVPEMTYRFAEDVRIGKEYDKRENS